MLKPPANFELLYSNEAIQNRIAHIGEELGIWASQLPNNSSILAVPILRGALFFAADLLRVLPFSCEIEPITSSAYDAETNTLREDFILKTDITELVKDKYVLLIDDICDSGVTLAAIQNALMAAECLGVLSVVAVQKKIANQKFTPDYVGFQCEESAWLVGYGMDDHEHYRSLSGIYMKRALD